MVAAKMAAPPSLSSSRLTEVTTVWRRPIFCTASATRLGSSQSRPIGRPVSTAQKPQLRVQTRPRIMNVAVLWPQHSPIFGGRTLSHSGRRSGMMVAIVFSFVLSPGRPPGSPIQYAPDYLIHVDFASVALQCGAHGL